MTEKSYQIKILTSLVVVVLCAGLYAWGGMEMKWLRRFIAPCIAAGYLAIINKDFMQLIKAPLLMAASCVGYGESSSLVSFFSNILGK